MGPEEQIHELFFSKLRSEKMADVDVDAFILLLSNSHLTVKRDAGAASIRPRAGVLHPAAVVGGYYEFEGQIDVDAFLGAR